MLWNNCRFKLLAVCSAASNVSVHRCRATKFSSQALIYRYLEYSQDITKKNEHFWIACSLKNLPDDIPSTAFIFLSVIMRNWKYLSSAKNTIFDRSFLSDSKVLLWDYNAFSARGLVLILSKWHYYRTV